MNLEIFVTTYNSESTLAEVLDSLRAQSNGLSGVRALSVGDDGSKDRTLQIVEERWRGCSVPLRVLRREKNLGEWRNVNETVASFPADTDWIVRLHADNPLKPHWLETMLDAMARASDRTATVCSSWDARFEGGRIEPGEDRPGAEPVLVRGGDAAVRDTLLRGCWWHNCASPIRFAAWKDIGGFPTAWRQKGDWEWLLRALSRGWDVLYLPRTLFYYAEVEGSVSSGSFRNDLDLRESAEIFRLYAWSASPADVLRFHAKELGFTARRLARALSRGDVDRMGRAVSTLGVLSAGAFSSLGARRTRSAR